MLLVGCQNAKTYAVSGTIEGLEGTVALMPMSGDDKEAYGEATVENGAFTIEVESQTPLFSLLAVNGQPVAPVFLEEGAITVNGRDVDDYFGLETLKLIVNQPFGVTNTAGKFDIIATVKGGGISGQAGAIRHGLARALVAADAENKPALKAAGFLTRDPRMKERKKYGLKGARRAPQFSKR